MSRLRSSRLLPAALLLLVAGPAWADPVRWDYATFVWPGFVVPDTPPPSPPGFPPGLPGSFGVAFLGNFGSSAGTTPIVFADWWAAGWLPPGQEVTFKHQPFQMGIGIYDLASNRSDVAVFTAYLDGSLSFFGSSLALSYAEQSKTLRIGGSTYTVGLGAMTLGGPTGGGGFIGASGPVRPWPGGSIAATVQVRKQPEPATLVLLGVGGSLTGLLYYRRRRRTKPAADA
jgi:hypothetical protein